MKDQYLSKDFVLELIYRVIDEQNNLNPKELKLKKSEETILIGQKGNLDSLAFLTFLVEVESIVKKNIDENIVIIDEILFSEENGPYNTIASLSEYILKKIK